MERSPLVGSGSSGCQNAGPVTEAHFHCLQILQPELHLDVETGSARYLEPLRAWNSHISQFQHSAPLAMPDVPCPPSDLSFHPVLEQEPINPELPTVSHIGLLS